MKLKCLEIHLKSTLGFVLMFISILWGTISALNADLSQSVFTWLKLTIETLEQGVKYTQS